jgi:hypothetical protein
VLHYGAEIRNGTLNFDIFGMRVFLQAVDRKIHRKVEITNGNLGFRIEGWELN